MIVRPKVSPRCSFDFKNAFKIHLKSVNALSRNTASLFEQEKFGLGQRYLLILDYELFEI